MQIAVQSRLFFIFVTLLFGLTTALRVHKAPIPVLDLLKMQMCQSQFTSIIFVQEIVCSRFSFDTFLQEEVVSRSRHVPYVQSYSRSLVEDHPLCLEHKVPGIGLPEGSVPRVLQS